MHVCRTHLFKACETSEVCEVESCGRLHLAIPIRDASAVAIGVIDIEVDQTALRKMGLMRLGKMAMMRVDQIGESDEEENARREKDERHFLDEDPEKMFDQMLLDEVKQSLLKINKAYLAELRAYAHPPVTIVNVVEAVVYLLYPDQWKEGDGWNEFKLKLHLDLLHDMAKFDPFNPKSYVPIDRLSDICREIEPDKVGSFGSYPTELIFEWFKLSLAILKQNSSMLVPNTE
ncbi:EF-hand calcium-binding domain-containing protein 5 [Cichlidogyrus casuarinus]|uniref:EF-hand calcium-binding domain-containing protein 5 n=1 Tax=Cichlidogyrus casuarinus TaxID=1844966 RepID=A0ABD2PW06_9PLAT